MNIRKVFKVRESRAQRVDPPPPGSVATLEPGPDGASRAVITTPDGNVWEVAEAVDKKILGRWLLQRGFKLKPDDTVVPASPR